MCFGIWEWLKSYFSFDESKFCTLKNVVYHHIKNVDKCVILHMEERWENWTSPEAEKSAPEPPRITKNHFKHWHIYQWVVAKLTHSDYLS